MILEQNKIRFQPITITLTSAEEASAFCRLIDAAELHTTDFSEKEREILRDLSNYFTSKAIF